MASAAPGRLAILEQRATVPPEGFVADLNPVIVQCLTHVFCAGRQPQEIGKAWLPFNQLMDGIQRCMNGLGMVGMGLEWFLCQWCLIWGLLIWTHGCDLLIDAWISLQRLEGPIPAATEMPQRCAWCKLILLHPTSLGTGNPTLLSVDVQALLPCLPR